MLDQFKRHIDYLRISVTDKCNLRCRYCMPEEGIPLLQHKDILSFEEIRDIAQYGLQNGISKIRLTGGEPLVRRDILKLVKMIGELDRLEDFSMTTNGTLLDKYAKGLKKNGIQRINVSLDSLDPDTYRYITRGGDLNKVLKGLETAKTVGFSPIKINTVVRNEADGQKVESSLKEFCDKHGFELRLIKEMQLEKGIFSVVEGGSGGDCINCNRIRLTSNGMLKPCLFSDLEFSVRKHGIEKAFELALKNKPASGTINNNGKFYNIGG